MYCPNCGSKAKVDPNRGATACPVCNSYYIVKYDGKVVPSSNNDSSIKRDQE